MNNEAPKDDLIQQYDNISEGYASLIKTDPAKIFVQYPAALKLLGNVKDKKILDIGCGDGTFTRMLARRGAKVIGYDPSAKQIDEAQKTEDHEQLGIKYFVGDEPEILPGNECDEAVSVLVLPYATDKENLKDIFTHAYKALTPDGSFSSITFNPDFKRLNEIAYNRRFTKTHDGKIQVDFLDEEGKVKISAKFSDFSVLDYENAAKAAGFTKIEWIKVTITQEGQELKGDKFWQGFEEDCPYIGIKVLKNQNM